MSTSSFWFQFCHGVIGKVHHSPCSLFCLIRGNLSTSRGLTGLRAKTEEPSDQDEHISYKNENLLFRMSFGWGPYLVDGLLDMPCLPDRPTKSYSAADRETKSSFRSCRSIDHTVYVLV